MPIRWTDRDTWGDRLIGATVCRLLGHRFTRRKMHATLCARCGTMMTKARSCR